MSELVNITLKPVSINPSFDRGSDTVFVLFVKDSHGGEVSLDGYDVKLEMRTYKNALNPVDTMSIEDGRILVDGSRVSLVFPSSITKDYEFDSAFYKIEATSLDGYVYRIAEGRITVR